MNWRYESLWLRVCTARVLVDDELKVLALVAYLIFFSQRLISTYGWFTRPPICITLVDWIWLKALPVLDFDEYGWFTRTTNRPIRSSLTKRELDPSHPLYCHLQPKYYNKAMRRNHDHLLRRLNAIMAKPISPFDSPGVLYYYFDTPFEVKVGRSVNARRRRSQWDRQCANPNREWGVPIWCPYTHRAGMFHLYAYRYYLT